MQTLEASLIALLEASDAAQAALKKQLDAQGNELEQLGIELTKVSNELRAREEENTVLRLSLEQLHDLLETSLNLQRTLDTRLQALESDPQSR